MSIDYRSADPIYSQCDCGEYVRAGRICSACGVRAGEGHTPMARGAKAEAAHYAIVVENIQYADERRESEVSGYARAVSARVTLAAAGLEEGGDA